jgi:G3E family GTPase
MQQNYIQPMPITVITGFLGAGKTSFLNHLLQQSQFGKTLVLINEFGEVGIDHLLIEKIDNDMMLLSSGCLCCTIRGDLITSLEDILRKKDNNKISDVDRIIIETTGLADPIPILQTLIQHPYLRLRFFLESVVTIVDAFNAHATIDKHTECLKQIAVADHILLSKIDLVDSKDDLENLKTRLREINQSAALRFLDKGKIDFSFVLNKSLYDPATKSFNVNEWLNDKSISHHHHHHDVNRHSKLIHSFCLRSEEPINPEQFELFIEFLRQIYGVHMLRVKGIICLSDNLEKPMIIHGVQHVFHPAVRLDHWPTDDHSTRIVFILYDFKAEFIETMWNALLNKTNIDKADFDSSINNPLKIDSQRGLLS